MTASALFRSEPLLEIIRWMQAELAGGAAAISLRVLDPDLGRGRYAGERVERDGDSFVHRPFRVWVDLAERLGLRVLTPRAVDASLIELRFERLDPGARWEADAPAEVTERYAPGGGFGRIAKLEDPGFVVDMVDALERVALGAAPRILDLGVNTGDELALLMALAPRDGAHYTGVDHSASALAAARARFGDDVTLHQADLDALPALGLGRFDLIVCLGTLQSPGLDDRALLRRLVQDHLAPDGALILGLPNCRYLDGETVYGARMKNFRQPELGLLVKDVAFYRKYLQQHRRQVFVTGKHELLVTAVPYPRLQSPIDSVSID